MAQAKDCLEIITMICFLYYIYRKTFKPYIKEVKQEKEQKPKKRKRLKYLRRIHLPYKGQAKIYKYDKQYGYINSAWDEVEKPKKKQKSKRLEN
jgi:hypothetical protein